MADLKPLGSEKLNGDDKLKRILELTYYKNDNNKNTNKAEIVKESKSGGVYGIVKERDGYYVKRGLNESSLDYIGGMFMKNKNKFSSYAEALKRLELIKGQEELLNEATKYVLKQNKPQEETPAPVPAMPEEPAIDDMPPSDASVTPSLGEPGMEEPAAEEPAAEEPSMDGEDMGGEEESSSEPKRSDYMAEVQKYAGKLGQELRDLHNKMESDDIKYVLNMIISAVDLDKLDDDDIEDIADKFDRDEEEGDFTSPEDDFSSEEPSSEETPEEEPISTDKELGEEDNPMDALENFINSSIDEEEYSELDEEDYMGMDEINIESYADLDEEDEMGDYTPDYVSPELSEEESELSEDETELSEEESVDEVEIDLEEIKKEINNNIHTTLAKYFK